MISIISCYHFLFVESPRFKNHLTENILSSIINECKQSQNWTPLIRVIGQAYSSVDVMLASFLKGSKSYVPQVSIPEKADLEISEKEQKRLPHQSGESVSTADDGATCDLDNPWQAAALEAAAVLTLDVEGFQNCTKLLRALPQNSYLSPLATAVVTLCRAMYTDLRVKKMYDSEPNYINLFVMVYDMVLHLDFENVLPEVS